MKKLQKKCREARDVLERWDPVQSRLLSQFGNAAAIIDRLPVLSEEKNYGGLRCIPGIKEALLGKQMESLEMILMSIKETMEEFHAIVISLDKIVRGATQLLKGGSTPTAHQMQLRIGIRPSLSDCLNGLKAIHEMHQSEYHLKLKVMSSLTYKCSGDDIAALRRLLEDQPNIPKDEVKSIFDVVLAEEIS